MVKTQSNRKIRVLHVISGLFYGGGQRVVMDLVRALPRHAEIDVRICLLGRSDTPLEVLATEWIPYSGRYNRLPVLASAAWRLRRVIRRVGPDIVHTHGVDADLIGGLALVGSRVRHVCHLHITPSPDARASLMARIRVGLMRYLFRRNQTVFIAVSDAVKVQTGSYYGLSPECICTVRNGIDVGGSYSPDQAGDSKSIRREGPLIVGTAGRLAPMKGFEYLLEALALLSKDAMPFKLRIAGTGSLRANLERHAKSLGINSWVEFDGQVADMLRFYRDIDVFVLPSVSTEGLPLVVLEAMAMGLPVVATDVAGTPEALRDGKDGFLVNSRDSEGLAHVIKMLAMDGELRRRMGESGHQRVLSAFTVQHMAKGVVQVYKNISLSER